ncbi:hypothetical protein CCL11_13345 [Pseudomonas syringae]|uniref:hypothetical protein n=1 Tax=Pseudomonas syringae TaxID=317 RepID=UPI000BB5C5B3|nr:hypothetical protein [Pseudomonas syringae]PBP44101.1 hypothetical protein CCL11_13345 [Pseudomonas syringae]
MADNSMNIVLTMAGHGARMAARYPDIPKWMVNVEDRLLIDWVLDDRIFSIATQVVVVCLRAHKGLYDFKQSINEKWPLAHINVVYLDHITKGQLRTAFHAFPFIEDEGRVIVRNIDTINFLSDDNLLDITALAMDEIYLPCFKSSSDQYSHYQPATGLLRDGYVEDALAVSGLYVFGSLSVLKSAVDSLQSCPASAEENMTLAVTRSRDKGASIRYGLMDACIPLGTPDEYDQLITRGNCLVR